MNNITTLIETKHICIVKVETRRIHIKSLKNLPLIFLILDDFNLLIMYFLFFNFLQSALTIFIIKSTLSVITNNF